ncbi:Alpha-2 giardin [Giardia muris]|uniref:Alpha-2 giardin n=1 Tax=Giardia muris TaxID=5742 RepID=A0A142C647_GIAMU|nr:alpha-2 giardin [Giardia muris]TNJ30460.1 Alpha-2 giardin [Giardia muris]|eukprot:TNJ30460.1 Alpha-2 giardin [Giardia muris]
MPKLSAIAADLKKAIDDKDEVQIAFIASEYSADSRQRIAQAYRETYGKEACDDVKKALKGGSEEDLLMDLWRDRHVVRAEIIKDALKGKNDIMALFDTVILCTPEDWHETCREYTQKQGKTLIDDFVSDVGTKDPMGRLFAKWMEHKRESRGRGADEEAQLLKKAFDDKDVDYLVDFFATIPHTEYKDIATAFKAASGQSIDQALAKLFVKNDYYTFYCCHFALLGLHKLAAYLINCAVSDKGDEKRMRRITGLMVDQCLAAKYAYKAFGDMGADFSRVFDKRMAPILRTLWRVNKD